MKILTSIVNVLIVVAIALEMNAIRMAYDFLSFQRTQVPIDLNLFWTLFMGIAFMTIVWIIAYLISITLIIKNKTSGYLISGIVSFFIFVGSIQQIVENHIEITLVMAITSLFWIALISMSFIARIKLTKKIK